jgi:hypothetical protein
MNRTTLGLVAILAAATLVMTTLAAAPAFAGGHYKGIGDGNTLTKQTNKAKASASGFGTIAANVQSNAICFLTPVCV